MRQGWRGRLVSAVVLIVALASRAAAQSAPSAAPEPVGSVGVMFSLLRSEEVTSSGGFAIDFARRIARSSNGVDVQIAGELGVNHFSEADDFDASTQASFLAGVRFAGRSTSGVSPFGQVLFGAISCCGSTDRALQAGAGVDVPLGKKTASLRLQVDVPVAYYSAGVDNDGVAYPAGHTAGFRFSVGVSFPFK